MLLPLSEASVSFCFLSTAAVMSANSLSCSRMALQIAFNAAVMSKM
uniref:Uncharacterized protein n=1 Tax=biofilter metagenome TaxID=1070537 RepID=A0A1A7GDA1_9ZZZZ